MAIRTPRSDAHIEILSFSSRIKTLYDSAAKLESLHGRALMDDEKYMLEAMIKWLLMAQKQSRKVADRIKGNGL